MKKAWLATITVLFTISVLVISSQAAYAGQTPEFAIKCYLGAGDPPVCDKEGCNVTVVDQFINDNVTAAVDQRYCVEALKHSDTAPPNPRYWVEHEDADAPNTNFPGVTIQDQFRGTFTARLLHFDLMVPANVTGPVIVPSTPTNQHYSGYFVDMLQPPINTTTQVMVTDQFGTSMITILHNTTFAFEATAIKDGQGTLTGQDLMCYMFDALEHEVPPVNPDPVMSNSTWVTQFNTTKIIDLDHADVLCVKANKIITPRPTPPVGGELLSIGTTALLLAGIQTNLAWILPVVLAGAGFAAFKLRRK